jgi:PAS domain S-box-containing protein
MPHTLSGFRVLARLHTGRRSVVYRARRLGDDQPVILKVSGPEEAPDQAMARYEHEHELLQSLHSDLVIKSHEIVRQGPVVALVLEDFGGESLRQVIDQRRLDLREGLQIGLHLAQALGHVHEAGIFHRDVNPQNIVYDAGSRVLKLIDFDVAIASRLGAGRFGTPGALTGTLAYMAPEQTGRMNRAADQRADLYALGMTLYQVFAGRLPHDTDDPVELVHFHLAVAPRPLDQISPDIPAVLSHLVMKLLAKAPEDRYQTAGGVCADLEIMCRQLEASGQIVPFALATQDHSGRFEISSRLYGRQAETRILLAAFDRAARGGVETVLLSGPSGVGKSSLVFEMRGALAERHGHFLTGKFDQLRRDVPYSALIAVFETLAAELLSGSERELARWRDLVTRATAPSTGVLVESIPALEHLLGPQAPVPPLDASGTQRRFSLTLQKFVQVFTRKVHPLVLFLDDMQWADDASANLLKTLCTSAETESLLLIAAFRDEQAAEARSFLDAVKAQPGSPDARIVTIGLAPLEPSSAALLLADTLHRDVASVQGLAAVLWRKTKGNPFFIRQFLHALYEQGLLVFNPETRRFEFELASIESASITENVADLLAHNMRRLPPETQRLLPLAAAIGHRFDLVTLATVAGMPTTAAHAALQPALIDELITPASELTYVRTLPVVSTFRGTSTQNAMFSHFAFQHDKIQQAAYAAVPPERHAPLHLAIGRALWGNRSAAELGDTLFDVVSHLNRGNALITAPAERATLAALNLAAGHKARGAAAHALAAASFRCAVAMCSWDEDHDACYRAHLCLAESLYLGTDFAGALQVGDEIARHARSAPERAELDALRATIWLNRGEVKQSLAHSRLAAAALGLDLPEAPAAIGQQMAEAMAIIFARLEQVPSVESLLDLPVMQDPEKILLMRLLLNTMPGAYMTDPGLFALICAKMVVLSFAHGNCAAAAGGYGGLAVVLHVMGQEERGYRFGKLSVAINERLDDAALRAKAIFQFAVFCVPWGEPLANSLDLMARAWQLGLEGGDYPMTGYSAAFWTIYGMVVGRPLGELLEQTDANRRLTAELGETITSRTLGLLAQLIRSYRGELDDPSVLDGNGVSESAILGAANAEGTPGDLFWLNQHRVEHRYLVGDFAGARALSEAAEAFLYTVPGSIAASLHRFYQSLTLTALWPTADAQQRAQWTDKLAANQAQMKHWTDLRPENFLPQYLLVEAERAGVGASAADPLELYDRAIAAAADSGFVGIEARANELAGGHWLARGKRDFAVIYLRRARDLYRRWGAWSKVQSIERSFREVGAAAAGQAGSAGTSVNVSEALDLASVLRASQAISGEILLDRLLAAMMEIILKNAGAQGGALLLGHGGALFVHAAKASEAASAMVLDPVSLAEVDWLPATIIHHVAATGESLVLDDASHDAVFATDAYVRARRSASILCMPIMHKAALQGVLYLENNLVRGAFTSARLEALEILVSQLAVSLENARLFAQQKEQGEALARMNEGLRTEISERQRAERELASYRDGLEELVVARTRELEESREQYRRIVESTNAVPFSYHPGHGFSYVGPQAEKLFGHPLERWKAPDFLEQLVPTDQLERTRSKLAGAVPGEDLEFEGTACTADKRILQLRWVVSCSEAAGERALRGLILDVTERWRLESDLAQAQKLESVGRLAAGVAHEINTPIQFVSDSVTFVRGAVADLFAVLKAYQELPRRLDDPAALAAAAADALRAEEDNDLAYIMEHAPTSLDRALDGLERVTKIVRSMKQFAHPDRKEKSPVDLNAALLSTLTIARNEYKYVAELETNFGAIPPVVCHAGEINQVVLNIVVNAAHAIADAVAGTDRKGKITVSTRKSGDQVEIAIGDTGPGIPEAIRQRIFDPFFTTKEVGRGTGQGLAIARNVITEKHGGSLTFDTELGRGTTFHIVLPVDEPGEVGT